MIVCVLYVYLDSCFKSSLTKTLSYIEAVVYTKGGWCLRGLCCSDRLHPTAER